MRVETRELVRAFGAMNQQMPRLVSDLLTNALPSTRQHEYASLLVQVGELLHEHADLTDIPDAAAIDGDDHS